jgi:hypothetical protein
MGVAKQAKGNRFSVSFRVNCEVGVEIIAADMDEAIAKAKEYKVEDVITMNGEHEDSEMVLQSVFRLGLNCRDGLIR